MSEVWKHSRAKATALLVLLCLADMANDERECWPSVQTIRRRCRLKDDRHVKRVIHDQLEKELGEVIVIPGGGVSSSKGGVRSNRYRITVYLPDETVVEGPLSESDGGSQTTQTVVERPPLIVVDQPPESSRESSSEPSSSELRARRAVDKLADDEVDEWLRGGGTVRTTVGAVRDKARREKWNDTGDSALVLAEEHPTATSDELVDMLRGQASESLPHLTLAGLLPNRAKDVCSEWAGLRPSVTRR